MTEKPLTDQNILGVFPSPEDRALLNGILRDSNWTLQFTCSFLEAQIALRRSPVGVVISEGLLSDGHNWKDLLCEMQNMKHPPPLIVADRLADERLWAEVLNLGAYDLLAKPFEAKEVLHAVSTACQRRENERRITVLPKPVRSPEHSIVLETKVRTACAR